MILTSPFLGQRVSNVFFNVKRMKKIHLEMVKSALKKRDFGTKDSIASDTGLRLTICQNILYELCERGEVREIAQASSTGGLLPKEIFVYNKNYSHVLLVYARNEQKTKSLYGRVVNLSGDKISEEYGEFDDISLKELESFIGFFLESDRRIQVISLGLPGIVRDGIVGPCDLKKLQYIPVKEYLIEKFGLIVTVSNDVNCTALGYYSRSNMHQLESLVYIYYPEDGSPGGGIIVNGKVLRGKSDFAGEVSFMQSWLNRKEQGDLQKQHKLITNYIIDTILSINCLINPDCIVLAGQWLTEEMKDAIRKGAEDFSLSGYSPDVRFEPDIHDSYINGLQFAGLRKLSCGF